MMSVWEMLCTCVVIAAVVAAGMVAAIMIAFWAADVRRHKDEL